MDFLNNFFNKSTTSTTTSTSSNVNIYPGIYILPCLQELKTGGRIVGKEYEQQPSKWENGQLKPLFSGYVIGSDDASNYFDRYWSGKDKNITSEVSKNGLLTIPDVSKYGFISECKKMSCTEKWRMYTQFLCDKFNEMGQKDKNVAILVTHHNRMRSTDLFQGLLPFRSKKISTEDGEEKSAYANNFCLKIQINPGQDPTYEIFFPGFPDKGDFKGNCSRTSGISTPNTTPNTTPSSSFSSDSLDNSVPSSGGGSAYYYECDTTNINTDLISAGIKEALNSSQCSKPITIFVIRHGNALHNKPVNLSDGWTTEQKRLDSCLTPLGMYQATKLAEEFKKQNVFSNSNVILCGSFLQRTQLTGLLLLEAAGVPIEQMQSGLNAMKEQAIIRYKNTNFDSKKFNNYPPANLDNASFEKYYNDLMTNTSGSMAQVVSQGGKRKCKKYTKKYNKKSKNVKKRKTKRRK